MTSSDDLDERIALYQGIRMRARLIRDNPDLPDARRMWLAQARRLAAGLAGVPCGEVPDFTGVTALLDWCASACGSPARDDPDGATAA